MKVFACSEIQALEQCAVQQGISLRELMERAGKAVADQAEKSMKMRFGEEQGQSVIILCGKGNNGGDGFVCASHLTKMHRVSVVLLYDESTTTLAQTAFQAMPETIERLSLESGQTVIEERLKHADCIIDAVFGFRFRGRISDAPSEILAYANKQSCLRISIDIPSGVECDTATMKGVAFHANETISFHGLKPALISYPGKACCGTVHLATLGVPASVRDPFMKKQRTALISTDEHEVLRRLPLIDTEAHKGTMGHLLMLCGSYGMAGACILAARAALRSGVGLLTIILDEQIYPIVANAVPEAVYLPMPKSELKGAALDRIYERMEKADACMVGSGLGSDAALLTESVLCRAQIPVLLDADALNAVAKRPDMLQRTDAPLVFTPHPGEMSRLTSKTVQEIQANRMAIASETAKQLSGVLVLKGAGTIIAAPDGRMAVNPSGNAGMATGGSGDALAGIIAAHMAQGISLYDAAVIGAYVHGCAGDTAAKKLSLRAMLPTDLIEALPEVYHRLEHLQNTDGSMR